MPPPPHIFLILNQYGECWGVANLKQLLCRDLLHIDQNPLGQAFDLRATLDRTGFYNLGGVLVGRFPDVKLRSDTVVDKGVVCQGSLHYTPCKWWFPFIFAEKAMFQMGKMYLLRSPVSCWGHLQPLSLCSASRMCRATFWGSVPDDRTGRGSCCTEFAAMQSPQRRQSLCVMSHSNLN